MANADDISKTRNRGVSLHISGLLDTITRPKLQEIFGKFGEVLDVHIPLDHIHRRVLGFAFVEMAQRESAEVAMKELDKKPIDGREITVAFAAERRKTADQMKNKSNKYDNRERFNNNGGGGRDRGYDSYRRDDERYRGREFGGRDERSRDDYYRSSRHYESRDNLRGQRDEYRPYESSRDYSRGPPRERGRGDNIYSREDDRYGRNDRWNDAGRGNGAVFNRDGNYYEARTREYEYHSHARDDRPRDDRPRDDRSRDVPSRDEEVRPDAAGEVRDKVTGDFSQDFTSSRDKSSEDVQRRVGD